MADSDSGKQWQVTCVCGWRTQGPKDDVVSAIIDHGKDTHEQDLNEEQAMSQMVPMS